MEKKIEFQNYNKAIIKHLYVDDAVLCDLQQVEILEDGSEQILSEDTDIVFTKGNYPFVLTNEDILELRPIVEQNKEDLQ